MAKIYLDEHDIVQVDYTLDGRIAREASSNRAFLDLADTYEGIAKKAIITALRQGRRPYALIEIVREVRDIRKQILDSGNDRNA